MISGLNFRGRRSLNETFRCPPSGPRCQGVRGCPVRLPSLGRSRRYAHGSSARRLPCRLRAMARARRWDQAPAQLGQSEHSGCKPQCAATHANRPTGHWRCAPARPALPCVARWQDAVSIGALLPGETSLTKEDTTERALCPSPRPRAATWAFNLRARRASPDKSAHAPIQQRPPEHTQHQQGQRVQ